MISLTITRTSLSLANLVITDDPFTGDFYLPEDGLSWPSFTMRRTYFADSEFAAGSILQSAQPGMGTHPLSICAHADTTAELFVLQDALEAALTQSAFNLTLSIDGQARTYAADPEFPQWGDVDSGMVRAHMARASVTVPLHPGAI